MRAVYYSKTRTCRGTRRRLRLRSSSRRRLPVMGRALVEAEEVAVGLVVRHPHGGIVAAVPREVEAAASRGVADEGGDVVEARLWAVTAFCPSHHLARMRRETSTVM